jgi:hypothetical protein
MPHSCFATPTIASGRFSRIASSLVSALVLGAPMVSAHAQINYARYKPGTIAAIMQLHDSTIRADDPEKHPALIVSGDDFPTLTRVVYLGDSRPVSPRRVDIVKHWGLTFRRDSTIVKNFHREYLFQEGKQLLWLPVQDTVASYFARELHPGQTVSLYVVWFGAYYADEDITWTFIVNDFEAERGATQ